MAVHKVLGVHGLGSSRSKSMCVHVHVSPCVAGWGVYHPFFSGAKIVLPLALCAFDVCVLSWGNSAWRGSDGSYARGWDGTCVGSWVCCLYSHLTLAKVLSELSVCWPLPLYGSATGRGGGLWLSTWLLLRMGIWLKVPLLRGSALQRGGPDPRLLAAGGLRGILVTLKAHLMTWAHTLAHEGHTLNHACTGLHCHCAVAAVVSVFSLIMLNLFHFVSCLYLLPSCFPPPSYTVLFSILSMYSLYLSPLFMVRWPYLTWIATKTEVMQEKEYIRLFNFKVTLCDTSSCNSFIACDSCRTSQV